MSMTMTSNDSPPTLLWFRDDLRLADNPALAHAAASGRPVVAVHVLDEASPGLRPLGGASRWWLHHALAALITDLGRLGVPLVLRRGAAANVIPALAAEIDAARGDTGLAGAIRLAVLRDLRARLGE